MTPNTKQIQSIERIQSFAMHPLETEKASTTGQRKRDNPIVSPAKAYWQTDTNQKLSQNRSQHKSRSQSSKLTKHSNITFTYLIYIQFIFRGFTRISIQSTDGSFRSNFCLEVLLFFVIFVLILILITIFIF